MKHLFTILILLTLFVSCENKNLCDTNSPTLIGSWIWVKSVGGIGGGTFTPEMTGERITLEITPDSTYRKYLNGSLIAESKFTLAHDVQSSIPYLKFNGLTSLSFEFIDCNNLILKELYMCDGYTRTYERLH